MRGSFSEIELPLSYNAHSRGLGGLGGARVVGGWGGGRGSNSQVLKPVPETLIPVYSPRSLRVLGGSLGCAGGPI